MSKVAGDLIEAEFKDKQAAKGEFVLGLATGNSPAGVYQHPAKAFNDGRAELKTAPTEWVSRQSVRARSISAASAYLSGNPSQYP